MSKREFLSEEGGVCPRTNCYSLTGCRYVFAMISLPYWRKSDWPREYLMISFGLPVKAGLPRIAATAEAYPDRWTHHVILERAEDLDGELLGWPDEAYWFWMIK